MFFCLVLAVVTSCVRCDSPRRGEGESLPATASLMRAVPSDAFSVLAASHASDLMALLDSTDAFRALDLGRGARRRAVLSSNYDGRLERLLVLEVAGDTTIVPDLSCLGAGARMSLSPDGQLLLISESANLLGAALRHLRAGTSILEAPGLTDALSAAGREPYLVMKNAGVDHWPLALPQIPDMTPRQLRSFIRTATRWTVILPDLNHRDQLRLLPVQEEKDTYYMYALATAPAGASQLADILPAETEFAVSLPLPGVDKYLAARERWLDANMHLVRYEKDLDALRKATGRNPKTWVLAQGIRELALVEWDGSRILAYRTDKRARSVETGPHPVPDCFATLFGALFDLPDESTCCTFGKWILVGSAADLEKFVTCETRLESAPWPEKNNLAVLYSPEGVLRWIPQGIEIKMN